MAGHREGQWGARERRLQIGFIIVVLSGRSPFTPVSESNVIFHREFDSSYAGNRLEVQMAVIRGILVCR